MDKGEKVNSISIVIPVLNEELYLPNLLAALSRQTYKNFEVIVVDGKSTDNTLGVAKKFEGLLPKLTIINAPHRGTSFQRNLGAARGEFETILFLDADINIPRDFLKKVITEFYKKKADIATTSSRPIHGKSMDLILCVLYNNYQKITKKIAPVAYGWMIMVKKRVHNKVHGFDEKLFFAEDTDYCQRIVEKHGKFEVLTSTVPYVSTRRANTETRPAFYKKMLAYYFYSILYDRYTAQKKINYRSGEFSKIKNDIKHATLSERYKRLNKNIKSKLLQIQDEISKI